jgi:predicted DNA-binding transcriptional regulator AlpA
MFVSEEPKDSIAGMSVPGWRDLEKIVSEKEAAELRGVSRDTLRRMAARGEGPKRIKLSPRRVGYKLREVLSA